MTSEEWRNHPHYEFDPLAEEIEPALLNSVDIKRYVDKGCLIEKANFSPCRLKTASYEMRLLGRLYDWNTTREGRLEPRCREICSNGDVELPRNSITYLWMKERLFLPEYIAARFNLHIRHVHRGILLGTGPLVDPGFCGSLLIPLHNLTDNNYTLKGGEGVIWIEFTKLSKNEFWLKEDKEEEERPDYLKSLSMEKDQDDPEKYFTKSGVTKAGGVQSAFRRVLDMARAETRKIRRFRNIGFGAIIVAFITTILGIMGVLFTGHQFISRIVDMTIETKDEQMALVLDKHEREIEMLHEQIEALHRSMDEIRRNWNEVDAAEDTRARPSARTE